MVTQQPLTRLIALMILLATAFTVRAEKVEQFGDYRIHYNAFVSTMLSPEVARTYGLTRSRYHAVVNITVQKQANGKIVPIAAQVTGSATNLYGKRQNLEMKQIIERDAIYYLAELPFSDQETLTFDIDVIPEGEKVVRNLSFKQQFFVD